MRPIKFRAWDRESQEMLYPTGVFISGAVQLGTDWLVMPEAIELMQFTGLLDKNGKEIYEGDIVKWDDQSKGAYWRVAKMYYDSYGRLCYEFLPSTTTQSLIGEIWYQGSFAYATETDKELEVVGNIYENPELLN